MTSLETQNRETGKKRRKESVQKNYTPDKVLLLLLLLYSMGLGKREELNDNETLGEETIDITKALF